MKKLEEKIKEESMYKKIWKGEKSLKKFLKVSPPEALIYSLETAFLSPIIYSCSSLLNPNWDIESNLINIGSIFVPATLTYVGNRIYNLFKKEER